MTDLKLLARCAIGMALGLVLFPALSEPVSGQVKTTVPDVVAGARPARMELITIHGKALEGNLEGNAVDRIVLVILPPSYATERNRRYPVVYALHGYSIGAEQWSQEIHVPQTVEGAFAKGAREMIVVLPDSKTVHNGSMYSSSVTTGDFENFIARDVVSYIDADYRTMPNRSSRGLVGHSMGGYGASRIGMKHADVFGSLYIMSPCCLTPRGGGPANPANEEALAAVKTPEDSAKLPFGLRAQLASAAAWSPNPNNPPLYLDLPTGSNQQEVLAKWAANSPLAFVDQYVQDLRQYGAIAIDVGDMDNLKAGASKLRDVLTSYGITHDFEIYSGTHTSQVAVRFQENVMPFFGKTRRSKRRGGDAMKWLIRIGAFIAAGAAIAPLTARQDVALKDLMPKGTVIGVAINQRQSDGVDTAAVDIITKQFNQISPENLLKFQLVHPAADRYAFEAQDRYVQFGVDRKMQVIGHTLVWHQQTPAWVFQGADGTLADRETLLARMRDHIHTVVGRYKGKIHGWDVVNEAIDEDGSLRKAPWRDGIGDDYVAKAFEFAREADPNAELYYNDYNLEKPAKRAGVIRLVKELRARGLRVDGIGNQAHWRLETPAIGEIEEALVDLHSTGLKVMYTELDVNLLPNAGRGADPAVANPYATGFPDEKQQQLAKRYADIFAVIVKQRDSVSRVTFWGLSDADSWLNRGRMNYPLLWDRQRQPKPAFQAVVDVLTRAR